MPISGLVVVLDQDTAAAPGVIEALRRRPAITVGSAPDPRRVPVTLESADPSEARRALRWIEDLPGVCMVEVAFVDFGEQPPVPMPNAHNGEDTR